jgi:chemotaxis protein CheX
MSAASLAVLTPEAVTGIVADVFVAFLGIEVLPVPPAPLTGEAVVGSVSISGSWQGTVLVGCSVRLARQATATMLALEEDVVTDEDVVDAVGELANMVGGNVKSMLAMDSRLSVPTVWNQAGDDPRDDEPLLQLALLAAGEPLHVVVREQEREVGR